MLRLNGGEAVSRGNWKRWPQLTLRPTKQLVRTSTLSVSNDTRYCRRRLS